MRVTLDRPPATLSLPRNYMHNILDSFRSTASERRPKIPRSSFLIGLVCLAAPLAKLAHFALRDIKSLFQEELWRRGRGRRNISLLFLTDKSILSGENALDVGYDIPVTKWIPIWNFLPPDISFQLNMQLQNSIAISLMSAQGIETVGLTYLEEVYMHFQSTEQPVLISFRCNCKTTKILIMQPSNATSHPLILSNPWDFR